MLPIADARTSLFKTARHLNTAYKSGDATTLYCLSEAEGGREMAEATEVRMEMVYSAPVESVADISDICKILCVKLNEANREDRRIVFEIWVEK